MTIRMRFIELGRMGPNERIRLLSRSCVPNDDIRSKAADIVNDVRCRGDAALNAFDAYPLKLKAASHC